MKASEQLEAMRTRAAGLLALPIYPVAPRSLDGEPESEFRGQGLETSEAAAGLRQS